MNSLGSVTWSEMGVAKPEIGRDSRVESRFDSLYRAHHREILAYFIRREIPRPNAEDAAADVFTVAWRRLDQIPDGDQAVGWLFGVAHKVLSNHRRSWRRVLRLDRRLRGLAGPPSGTPELQVVMAEEDQILIRALNQLRRSDREILKLATWEKLPHSSIGELLAITQVAVDQRISRARKRLARELDLIESKQKLSVPLLRRRGG